MIKKNQKICLLYIIFTLNNIFYVLVNPWGKIITWTSCGRYKVKGLKKITVNSIKISLSNIINKLSETKNHLELHIKLKGLNKFKKIVLKQLKQLNLNILSLCDEIVVLHGGCKKKKQRKL